MFDFEKPEDGSQERFHERTDPAVNPQALPPMRHHFWWLLHNLVAHPFIGIAPIKVAFDFHDWTSRKMSGATEKGSVSK